MSNCSWTVRRGCALRAVSVTAAALVASGAAAASDSAGLLDDVKQSFGLRDAELAHVPVGTAPGQRVVTAIPLDGIEHALRLDPHAIRSANYTVLVQGADGSLSPAPPRPHLTMRGAVLDVPGSVAVGAVHPDGLYARVMLPDGTEYWIEPVASRLAAADAGTHVVYASADVIAESGRCAAEEIGQVMRRIDDRPRPTAEAVGAGVCVAELAVDTDAEYFSAYGSVSAVEDRVNLVINTMNLQYETQVGITHILTTIIVRPSDPDPYTGADAGTLIFEMRSEWMTNQSGIQRDMAQLFTGRTLINDTQGVAWGGTVCDFDFGYSVVQSDFGGTLACATDLSAHELGHNWDADHCDCVGWTMNFFVTCVNVFNDVFTIPEIVAFRDSLDCLSGCPVGCPPGEVLDCNGLCAPSSWVGDGICNDGFDCAAFQDDGGDCQDIQIDNLATADFRTGSGEVGGTYLDTHVQDDVYESVKEEDSGGPPSQRRSFLSHTWTFDVADGQLYTFMIDAFHTPNSEGDDFTLAYSLDNVAFTDMLTVTGTTDDDQLQTFVFAENIGGATVFVRIEDDDRTAGNGDRDTVFIDEMAIETTLLDPVELLLNVLANWGNCPPPPQACPGDINGDGKVDVSDLLIALSNWD